MNAPFVDIANVTENSVTLTVLFNQTEPIIPSSIKILQDYNGNDTIIEQTSPSGNIMENGILVGRTIILTGMQPGKYRFAASIVDGQTSPLSVFTPVFSISPGMTFSTTPPNYTYGTVDTTVLTYINDIIKPDGTLYFNNLSSAMEETYIPPGTYRVRSTPYPVTGVASITNYTVTHAPRVQLQPVLNTDGSVTITASLTGNTSSATVTWSWEKTINGTVEPIANLSTNIYTTTDVFIPTDFTQISASAAFNNGESYAGIVYINKLSTGHGIYNGSDIIRVTVADHTAFDKLIQFSIQYKAVGASDYINGTVVNSVFDIPNPTGSYNIKIRALGSATYTSEIDSPYSNIHFYIPSDEIVETVTTSASNEQILYTGPISGVITDIQKTTADISIQNANGDVPNNIPAITNLSVSEATSTGSIIGPHADYYYSLTFPNINIFNAKPDTYYLVTFNKGDGTTESILFKTKKYTFNGLNSVTTAISTAQASVALTLGQDITDTAPFIEDGSIYQITINDNGGSGQLFLTSYTSSYANNILTVNITGGLDSDITDLKIVATALEYETDSKYYSVNISSSPAVCFLGDAPVLTPRGYRPIREFRVGDLVTTAEGREVAVKRVFQRSYGPSASTNPYVIPKGFLGCLRPIAISPNHEVLIPGRGMMKAKDLGLRRMKMAEDFTYYNLELEDWVRDNLVVGGVIVESLAPAGRITMTKEEFTAFVKARYGPSAAARLRSVCFAQMDGTVSLPAFV